MYQPLQFDAINDKYIPKELCNAYKVSKYKFLIHGFVKEIGQRHNLYYNVPFYLKEIILKYYPCFLYVL